MQVIVKVKVTQGTKLPIKLHNYMGGRMPEVVPA